MEAIKWEDSKEIMPILRDKQVLKALCHFLNCSQNSLKETLKQRLTPKSTGMVTLRGSDVEKKLTWGYFDFLVDKWGKSKEKRRISAPSVPLKRLQKSLLVNLRQVPVSTAVQWWELGTRPSKNANFHRQSGYLLTTDIASAYPSVDAGRINANLNGWLEKIFDLSYPYLDSEQRKTFVDVLTTLTSHEGKLPQWSPTSARMLNIVMWKTDSQIIWALNDKNSILVNPMFTRYIDDMAISFKYFENFWEFSKAVHKVIKKIKKLGEEVKNNSNEPTTVWEEIDSILLQVEQLLVWFINIETPAEKIFEDQDSKRRTYNAIILIKQWLEGLRDNEFIKAKLNSHKEKIFTQIWILDKSLKWVDWAENEDQFEQLRLRLIKIVQGQNNRKLKFEKEKMWTPLSATAKEITWITIWPDGRLGIAEKKMLNYIAFAKLVAQNPKQLSTKYLTTGWEVDVMQVAYVLHGIRNFIKDIKRKVPNEFDKRFKLAKKNLFPKVKIAPNVIITDWVSPNSNLL